MSKQRYLTVLGDTERGSAKEMSGETAKGGGKILKDQTKWDLRCPDSNRRKRMKKRDTYDGYNGKPASGEESKVRWVGESLNRRSQRSENK